MKTIVLSSRKLVISITICLLFVSMQAVNALEPKSFVYNKSDDNEIVYLYDSTLCALTPYLKYDFTSSKNGQEKNKTAYYWNSSTKKWAPYYMLSVTTIGENQIHEFAIWNSKTNDFSLNKQKAIYYKETGKDIPAYVSFIWNNKQDKWEVKDANLLENYMELMVNNAVKSGKKLPLENSIE